MFRLFKFFGEIEITKDQQAWSLIWIKAKNKKMDTNWDYKL